MSRASCQSSKPTQVKASVWTGVPGTRMDARACVGSWGKRLINTVALEQAFACQGSHLPEEVLPALGQSCFPGHWNLSRGDQDTLFCGCSEEGLGRGRSQGYSVVRAQWSWTWTLVVALVLIFVLPRSPGKSTSEVKVNSAPLSFMIF
jgi:hypothetical protein